MAECSSEVLGRPRGAALELRGAAIEPEAWWPSWSSRRTGFDLSAPRRRDVPMLLDGGMRLIEPACLWLMHVALVRGRTRSRQTWRTYGEALYDWWQTLEADGWAWDEVGTGELAAYRDHMLQRPRRPHRQALRSQHDQWPAPHSVDVLQMVRCRRADRSGSLGKRGVGAEPQPACRLPCSRRCDRREYSSPTTSQYAIRSRCHDRWHRK